MNFLTPEVKAMRPARYLMVLLLAVAPTLAPGQEQTLRNQLGSLSKESGITIDGMSLLGDEEAEDAGGDLRNRIEGLLSNYNYLIIEKSPGHIAKVIVTSLKQATPPPATRTYVKTVREGRHHRVNVEILGLQGHSLKASLLVDTGASVIVLPYSMIESLGFKSETLADAVMQTANGQTAGKIGLLKTVTVGNVSANDVEVGFVPDDKLVAALLGMSFLARFKLTLDDAHDELILLAK